jgi:hypothetical protein
MVSCGLTGTCTTALRGLVKRGDTASLPIVARRSSRYLIDREITRHI